jgi:3-deoxy-D-manno-octulosonic-acid transferase
MSVLESLYTGGVRALSPLLPFLERGDGKLARGVRGRARVLQRMEAWVRRGRDPARPLVWFHAPSVGEGLQARAVMEEFRARRPDAQVVYTFFSPSAEGLARRVPADYADYLPLDLPAAVERALDLLRPEVIAFSKTDVWPNLTRAAAARGTRLALLSATLPAGSSRLGLPARALLAPAYRRLDRVAAISADDAARFAALGVPEERRTVMGDARVDQVLTRAAAVDPDSDLLRPLRDEARVVIVAGSTWPADEERLVAALARLPRDRWRLVLTPHEPTEAHLAGAESLLAKHGLRSRRLAAVSPDAPPEEEVVLVDRVGVLGDLYAVAEVAYVGGGWGTAGLHSVLEPAAFGLPVLFGPRHSNAREAADLVEAGAAFSVADGAELERRLGDLLANPAARATAGAAARAYVASGRGAAGRGAGVVEELMKQSGSQFTVHSSR